MVVVGDEDDSKEKARPTARQRLEQKPIQKLKISEREEMGNDGNADLLLLDQPQSGWPAVDEALRFWVEGTLTIGNSWCTLEGGAVLFREPTVTFRQSAGQSLV